MTALRYEDVTAGDEIPPLVKCPDTRQLVMYAGASDDYTPIHYDKDLAAEAGHRSVIVHGALKSAFLAQMLTDWIGEPGRIDELSVSYRAVDYAGDPLTCRGRVREKRIEDGRYLVSCDVWIENAGGAVTTPGSAVASLPSKVACT